LAESNAIVIDEVLKCVSSNVGPSRVEYNHGRQIMVANPEDQLLLQQTGMMRGNK
jgi:hypothetical protein